MLVDRGWHLAVCVTDLPLQTTRRPVIAHVSTTHGAAVLSMPALGPVSVRKRTVDTIVRLIGHILGDIALAADAGKRRALADAVTRRMRELGTRVEHGEQGVGFAARVFSGNIWLLLGMLRANRPWRLALRLMRVLAAAFAAGVFALVFDPAQFPVAARVGQAAGQEHQSAYDPEHAYQFGLGRLIAGIDTLIQDRAG